MNKHSKKSKVKKQGAVEIREDLQNGERGKDLSYLNEMPQMGGYEGVKAGMPPPKHGSDPKETSSKK